MLGMIVTSDRVGVAIYDKSEFWLTRRIVVRLILIVLMRITIVIVMIADVTV